MSRFLEALGLVFVIEETPDQTLRLIGLLSAIFGLAVIWFMRG
jgi:uncharacterized protein YjeT (DUF2065 family)